MDAGVYQLPLATPKSDVGNERRSTVDHLRRHFELEELVQESRGCGELEPGYFSALPSAVQFSHQVLAEKRRAVNPDPQGFRTSDLLAAKTYEAAPSFFELALSDEAIRIAAAYLGEIPVLAQPRLWWTKPTGQTQLRGTQKFHIGSRHTPPVRRQAKFLINMSDVDDESGPFTYMSADVSETILSKINYKVGEEVTDEEVYRHARPDAAMKLVGPAGTGLFVDTCRCFHFGRRASSKERLMLMIQFKRPIDMPEYDRVERSPAFMEKFGHDPVRMLVVPEW